MFRLDYIIDNVIDSFIINTANTDYCNYEQRTDMENIGILSNNDNI